jgi:soluble lytic murein transglycosylase-like protein
MKILPSIALIFISLALASSADAQKVFDNFDRAQGVNVILPPAPKVESIKKGKRGKYAAAQNQLVKRTVLTANVTDGLATREGQPLMPASYSKLTMASNAMLKGFTTGNPLHDSFILDSSRRYGIDPLLIYSQMHQESSFKLTARSYKGASGLMQLMPATARRFGVTQIYDPKQNIDAGVRYMRWLLDTFNGDVVLALAGYNAGEGAVMKYGWNIPPYRETQEYVRRITSRYNSISDGTYVQMARRSNTTARFEQKESRPLTAYEPSPIAVRTSDGQLMLVNQ